VRHRLAFTTLAGLLLAAPFAAAQEPTAPPPAAPATDQPPPKVAPGAEGLGKTDLAPPPPASPDAGSSAEAAKGPGAPIAPKPLFTDDCLDQFYDQLQNEKKEYHVPIGVGAWDWEHLNSGGPNRTGFGIPPNQEGTYYWYIDADPEMILGDDGPVSKIGGHVELRLREQGEFRPYYTSDVWTYEAYLFADTDAGRFKVGQIVERFGLEGAGDGSFWGTIPYFDGFNLNPSYGAAWEAKLNFREDFHVDAVAQFFFADDGVAGEIVGSNIESYPGAHEHANGVVRVVPTWVLADQSKLALGFSGSVADAERILPDGGSDTLTAWAFDATYDRGGFRVFGEVLQNYGVLNPVRYVSGGPSSRITDLIAGTQYVAGPATFRFTYSAGFDEGPSGWQQLFCRALRWPSRRTSIFTPSTSAGTSTRRLIASTPSSRTGCNSSSTGDSERVAPFPAGVDGDPAR